MNMPKYKWDDVYSQPAKEYGCVLTEETDSRMYRLVKSERLWNQYYSSYNPLSPQEDYIFPRFTRQGRQR